MNKRIKKKKNKNKISPYMTFDIFGFKGAISMEYVNKFIKSLKERDK